MDFIGENFYNELIFIMIFFVAFKGRVTDGSLILINGIYIFITLCENDTQRK